MTTQTSKARAYFEARERDVRNQARTDTLAVEALEEGAQAIEWVIDLAISNGMADNKPTLHNAQSFIRSDYGSAKTELDRRDEVVAELGYKSFDKMAEAVRRTTGETRNRKSLTYYREVLPAWATEIGTRLTRFAGVVGQQKIDRYLQYTFYPLLEQYLDTNPEEWAVTSVQTAWASSENLSELERIYNWMCDRLEGLEERRPTDKLPLAPWIEDLGTARLGPNNAYGETFIQSVVAFAKQADLQAERAVLNDQEERRAGSQMHWVLREYTDTGADSRVISGLETCGYAKGGQMGDKVTLDLYLECFWAIKEHEDTFENHEDAYEVIAQTVARYEKNGNYCQNINNLLNRVVVGMPESDEEFDIEAMQCLEQMGVL